MPNGDTATLRMLASMTSGIPPYSFNEEFQSVYFADPATVFAPQQLVDYVKDSEPSFPAGTKVEYSNTNTVLLGMVIEKVTGRPFADVLQEGILGPLGLAQTSFPADSPALPSPHLDGITEQADPEGQVKDATNFNPSWDHLGRDDLLARRPSPMGRGPGYWGGMGLARASAGADGVHDEHRLGQHPADGIRPGVRHGRRLDRSHG
jgi:CubicO group peptidase (beta-lactamase class C family)